MKALLHDTLARRLFLLMWVALVASHLAGYLVVHVLYLDAGHAPTASAVAAMPGLPPTPGMPDAHDVPSDAAALPLQVLLLDYGVRIAVIALAAWWGSRWLARPTRDLVAAAQGLGGTLTGPQEPALLDEGRGTREVREAARVFNAMARRLREQFKARGLMVAAISHDLRTPLTRLRMRIDAMDGDTGALLRQRAVEDIREMDRLIDTVLDVFRGDALDTPGALQDTDVVALVQSLTDDWIEQGEAVHFAADDHGVGAEVVRAEPAALRRVVGNLVGNALRYAGRAEVSVRIAGAAVRILVEDRGPGIAPQHLDAVFEPFFRVESSRNRQTGGTGLGLYIARELALRQGVQLSLANRPGGGLRAELRFPEA